MRKLASIQRIISLDPIPNADAIMKATVLGWQLVVKKNEFDPGDLCVYVEIDSVLPEVEAFEFLRNKKFRIRTIKMRGQISQGICFPLSILPEGIEITEDMDVTDILNISKYEPPIPASLTGVMKGNFPSFIPKTDETRVQVLQKLLYKYEGEKCYITEKLDGTSVTYYIRDGVFGVCSRNMDLIESDENTYWKMARAMDIENKLRNLGKNIAIQGELVGESIQGNKLKIKGQTVFFFNVFLIDEYRYASYNEWKDILENQLELATVPVLSTSYILETDISAILKMSEITSTLCPEVIAEGIVIRLLQSDEHVSFKAINNEFLLKYED